MRQVQSRPVRDRWPLFLGAIAVVAGLALAFPPPRITLLNTAVRIDYPWPRGVAAVLAGVGAAVLSLLLRGWARWALGLAALLPAVFGAAALSFRLEAGPGALSAREWFQTRRIPWREVSRVEPAADGVVVHGAGSTVAINTRRFAPHDRAVLERVLSRRVAEANR